MAASGKKALPLTPKQLKNIFEKSEDLYTLCVRLKIPEDKRKDAESATQFYNQSKALRKARRLIYCLDKMGETDLAETVMECAEPPADPSLSKEIIVRIFEVLNGDWKEIGSQTIVPDTRAALFQGTDDQLTERAANYYICYHEDPSWKKLSICLYRDGRTEALHLARPYVQTVRDRSLTTDNIVLATKDIALWEKEDSYEYLDIPESQHEEITEKYDDEQAKRELVSTWLASHPCPSWDHVVELVKKLEWGIGRDGLGDELEEKYLRMTPERAKQILDDALQDGSLPQGYLKVLAAGPARSGKTISKKKVFKIKYNPNCSKSTGVYEAPIHGIRPFCCKLFNARLTDLVELTPEIMNEILACKLRDGLLHGNVAEVAKEIIKSSQVNEERSPTPAQKTVATTSPVLSPDKNIAKSSKVSSSGDSGASKAVVTAFYDDSQARDKAKKKGKRVVAEEVFRLQVILFLDSGGQPQFHEIIPAVNHNVCLVLLFLKLNERLDAPCCTAFTDENGEWFTERCSSLLTNEQMLLQFIHTMICKPLAQSENMRTKFMVIGTHRDLMHECEDETLEQKNERLASLLLPALKDELIMNGDNIIFDVNAKNPEEKDEKCFDLIRYNISDLSVALEQVTPLSFLMLQNDLISYGKEYKKKVVSMEKCQDIAGRLKMDRQTLEAALIHFNKLSMFLYMPSILPGLVFIDPQMPLDSVNRIVGHSYQVGCGAIIGLTPSESQRWKEGVVTLEMLKGDMFSSCFVSGLFEAEHALKFFQSLYITASLNESEFIMPAMLPTVSGKDIKEYLPAPSEHVSPLFLHFPESRIANGIFCSTHACMRSEHKWTTRYKYIKQGRSVPVCLFRNAVSLQHPSEAITITFINAVKHFEVHLHLPQADLPRMCPEICNKLLDAVNKAVTAFRFTNSKASIAFPCSCDTEDVHAAIVHQSNLKCTFTNNILPGGLTTAQKVWLGTNTDEAFQLSNGLGQSLETGEGHTAHHGGSTLANPQTHLQKLLDIQPTLLQLTYLKKSSGEKVEIINTIASQWKTFGIHLNFDRTGHTIDNIDVSNPFNPVACCTNMMKTWLNGEGTLPATWANLVKILRNAEFSVLADNVEKLVPSIVGGDSGITGGEGNDVEGVNGEAEKETKDQSESTKRDQVGEKHTDNSSTIQGSRATEAEQPSLLKLLNFSTFMGDTINITSEVGSEYENFGIFLLNDMDGEIVDEITEKHSTPEKIVKEILKHWIRGKGKQPRPVSWETLIDALKATGLTELASCIHKSL